MRTTASPLLLVLTLIPGIALYFLLVSMEQTGMELMVALAAAPILLYALARFPTGTLCTAIFMLGVLPYHWGVGSRPKIFLDEILLLGYVGYFLFSYLVLKRRTFRTGGILLPALFGAFLGFQALPFLVKTTNLIAARNFFETCVFGVALFYLAYNEIDRTNRAQVVTAIVWTTLVLSVLVAIERATGYNPFIKDVPDALFITSEIAEKAHGVYRPYLGFLTPSEAGTFIALGLPFVLWQMHGKSRLAGGAAGLVLAAAIAINYTRGVWVAVAVTAVLFIQTVRRYAPLLLGVLLLLLVSGYFMGQSYPAIKRLYDPANLLNRFFYWRLAMDILKKNFLIGIGHANFKTLYLHFVTDVDPHLAGFDIKTVFVPDNAYLTTLVEHGLVGFFPLMALFAVFVKKFVVLARQFTLRNEEALKNLATTCLMSFSIYAIAGLLADVHLFLKPTKLFFIIMGLGFSLDKEIDPEGAPSTPAESRD